MLKTEIAEKMNRQFAETLKKLRTNKGLSQRELAEADVCEPFHGRPMGK